MRLVALLPSPLLGCAMWQPVASILGERGLLATAVDVRGPAPASAHEALCAYLDALPDDELVLVPHSNAGLYVSAIVEQRRVSAVVFVDASLPPPSGGDVPLVPPEFFEVIASKADARGTLPIWSKWWNDRQVDLLFPNSATRAEIEHQQRRLPMSYFEDTVRVPSDWTDRPCAYLAFGDTYRKEAETARRLGWPVHVLDGQHLEMVVHPSVVADALLALLASAVGGRG